MITFIDLQVTIAIYVFNFFHHSTLFSWNGNINILTFTSNFVENYKNQVRSVATPVYVRSRSARHTLLLCSFFLSLPFSCLHTLLSLPLSLHSSIFLFSRFASLSLSFTFSLSCTSRLFMFVALSLYRSI